MFINIPPLTKYIRELTEYQILIFGIQPDIELFGEYLVNPNIELFSCNLYLFIYMDLPFGFGRFATDHSTKVACDLCSFVFDAARLNDILNH